ncbi:ABC-type transporter ATP-binding protein EcsA [mine drainage metagenome]|uniref:ABC-type transporter ATP-binding protein EcsA n=1 Tax=mine drainage metagenome TaxID=410659 RepID=A0A1J5QGL0_9ZZZZ
MREGLTLDAVTRRFGDRLALDGVSFEVRPGRVTGFVGANGAGKTTTMRIIMGVLAADSGHVRFGARPVDLPLRRQFGYMPEERGLYPKMKVVDQLVYLGRIHGLDAATARTRAEALLDALGLAERRTDVLGTLSLGNQQRVQVAAALLHDPVLLVLDEPFSGLDPLAVDLMAERLRERADAGVPVLFSSHQLELVERLCDDVVIISAGTVAAAGDARALRRARAGRRLRVVVTPSQRDKSRGSADGSSPLLLETLEAEFARASGVTAVGVDGDAFTVDLDEGADAQVVLATALRHGDVEEFGAIVPTLADIFREVVR